MQRVKARPNGGPVPSQTGKRKRRRNRRKRSKQTNGGSPHSAYRLSDCAHAYLRVIADPFDSPMELPCIPDLITIPSRKMVSRSAGTFSAGTQGVGWVVVDPWRGVIGDGSALTVGQTLACLFTNNAYTVAGYQWQNISGTLTTGVTGVSSNSPFSTAQITQTNLGTTAEYRLVGAGLRVRYTGTELNRGGRLLMYRARGNQSIVGSAASSPVTNSTTLQYEQVYSPSPVTRTWREITYMLQASQELSYVAFQQNHGAGQDQYCMLAYVDGTLPGNAFEFQVIYYYELIGPQFGADLTPSHADPIGFGAVTSSIPMAINDTGPQLYNNMISHISSSLGSMTQNIVSGLSNVAVAGIGTALGVQASRRKRLPR